MDELTHSIPQEWLGSETSIAEVEAGFAGNLSKIWLAQWRSLVNKMQPGDELRRFPVPGTHGVIWRGRAGYALVRQGVVIDSVVTLMN